MAPQSCRAGATDVANLRTRQRKRNRAKKLCLEPLEDRLYLDGSGLCISEFLAVNDSTVDDYVNRFSDWIEIHNTSNDDIDLAGYYLTDDTLALTQWQFPSVNLASGDHLLVWASGDNLTDPASELHTNFKLTSGGEYLALVAPDGMTVVHDYTSTNGGFPEQFGDISFGIASDGSETYFLNPTPAAPNAGPTVPDATPRILVNEINYHPDSEQPADEFIEFYNAGLLDVDISGWEISRGVSYVFPPTTTLEVGEYLVVAADMVSFQANYPGVTNVVGPWDPTTELNDGGEEIELSDETGTRIDRVTYADEGDWSVRARGPDDRGHRGWIWQSLHDAGGHSVELVNPVLSNRQGQNWEASVIVGGTPGVTNSVASNDIAPLVLDVSHSPLIPSSSDVVTLTAEFRDELAGVTASVFYRLDRTGNTDPFIEVTMADDGLNGDLLAGDGIFSAQLPAQADDAIVEFYVSATDVGANQRIWPEPTLLEDGINFGQVTNLLYQVDDTYTGNLVAGDRPIYYVVMTEDERAELAEIGDGPSSEAESNAQMNASFYLLDGAGESVRYRSGIRNRGSSSRVGPPNNQRVNVASDNPLRGSTAYTFNARYPQSQSFGSVIYQAAGIATEDTRPVQLRVNGENIASSGSIQYGGYAHVEVLNSDWVQNHFPNDSDGNLYSIRDAPSQQGDLRYEGPDPGPYRDTYFKQTNQELDDWSDLINLTNVLNNATDENFFAEVSQLANLEEWFRFFAADTLIANAEGGLPTGRGDDYTMYRGTIDTRFMLIPHDLDTVLGEGDTGFNASRSIFNYENVDGMARLFTNPETVPLYFKYLLELSDTVFTPEFMEPLVDQILGDWVPASRTDQIKSNALARVAYVKSVVPVDLTVVSGLAQVGPNSIYQTTDTTVLLSGESHAADTRSVLVDGQLANWNARDVQWSLDNLTLNPGLNTLLVQAFDATNGNGNQIDQATIEIWFDDGDQTDVRTFYDSIPTEIIAADSEWNYLDDGSDQGTAWRERTFDDSAWSTGTAHFGFGESDQTTLLTTGSTTYYFRQSFDVADLDTVLGLGFSALRDDGIAIYLNGFEIGRDNLIADAAFDDTADSNIAGANEPIPYAATIDIASIPDGALLATGNELAVEIHQSAVNMIDISFEMTLDLLVEDTGSCPATDFHWTAADGPYHVLRDLVVPSCSSLTIDPGVSVFFEEGTGLEVNGTIDAQGTALDRIRFTSVPDAPLVPDVPGSVALPDAPPKWRGIHLVDTISPVNIISFADIEHAQDPEDNLGSIGAIDSEIIVDSVTFSSTHLRMFYSDQSSVIIRNSVFADMFAENEHADALGLENIAEHIKGVGNPRAHFIIENNVFGTNKGHNDIIDVDSARRPAPIVQIIGNYFSGVGDELIDLGGEVFIADNVFTNVFKDDETSDLGFANAISTGDRGSNTTISVVRNVFYEVDHAVNLKVDTSAIFENNTVVNIHADFIDDHGNENVASALNFYVDEPGAQPGDGAYASGNIFLDVPRVIGNADLPVGTSTPLQLEQNFLDANAAATSVGLRPGTILDLGSGNLVGNPLIKDLVGLNFQLRDSSTARATGPFGQDFGALVPDGIWISGQPAGATFATDSQITVGGPGYFAFQYRVDGGPWSAETDIGNGFVANATVREATIFLTNLAVGQHLLEVIGQDFAGNWQTVPTAATWTVVAVNELPDLIVINEILASNRSANPLGATFPDYIELTNLGPQLVDIGGWTIADSASANGAFTFPLNTTIESGGFLVLYADSLVPQANELHVGFGLNDNGEGIYLFDGVLANGAAEVDRVEFGLQIPDYSIGRRPDGVFDLTVPTPAAENVTQPRGDSGGLVINEWFTGGQYELFETIFTDDFVELFNSSALPVALGGMQLTDDPVDAPDKHTIAALSFIAPTGLTVFTADRNTAAGPEHLNFGLSSQEGWIGLYEADLTNIDLVHYGPQTDNYSHGRSPDGATDLAFFAQPTPGVDSSPPTIPERLRITLVSDNQNTLEWNESVDPETGVALYRIYRDGTAIGTTTELMFFDTTVVPAGSYVYHVTAENNDTIESGFSNAARTDGDLTPPSIPTEVRVVIGTSNEVELTWLPSVDLESGVFDYTVYRDGVPIGNTVTASFIDASAAETEIVTYTVAATNNDLIISDRSEVVLLSRLQDGRNPNEGYAGTRDTWIDANNVASSNGNDDLISIDGEDPLETLGLIRWDLSVVPLNAVIHAASITVTKSNHSSSLEYSIFEALRDWSEGEATWTEASAGVSWEADGASGAADRGAEVLGTIVSNSLGTHTYELSASGVALLQTWLSNSSLNRGFIISNPNSSNGFEFASREGGVSSSRPQLSIGYTVIADTTPPVGPTQASGSDDGASTISLTWDVAVDNDSGIGFYRVYRDGAFIGTSTNLSYNDDLRVAGTDYSYQIQAVNGQGMDGELTDAVVHSIVVDETPPPAPANLATADDGFSTIFLTWNAVVDGESGVIGYRVFRDSVLLDVVTLTSFTDTSRQAEVEYSYELIAINGQNQDSATSAPADHTIIPLPQQLVLATRDSYLPGVPVLVRLDVRLPNGETNRDIWDSTATLTASDPSVLITDPETGAAVDTVTLYNGRGSVLVNLAGGGDFTLTADHGGLIATKDLVSLEGQPETILSGTIPDSQTWSGIIRVTGNILVPVGDKLTISAGTLVLVEGDAVGTETGNKIEIEGELEVQGTLQQPVTITSTDYAMPWGHLDVDGGTATLDYAVLSRAGNAPHMGHTSSGAAIRIRDDGTLTFRSGSVADTRGKILESTLGTAVMENSLFTRAAMGPEFDDTGVQFIDNWIVEMAGVYHDDGVVDDNDGIYFHSSLNGDEIRISGGVLANVQDDGVDWFAADVIVEDYIVRDAPDKLVSGTNGHSSITSTLLVNGGTGIKLDDLQGGTASLSLDRVTIAKVDTGLFGDDVGGNSPGNGTGSIVNTIIQVNNGGDPIDWEFTSTGLTVNYSLLSEDWNFAGSANNLNVDPLFVADANNDFRLQPSSPAIDSGDPNSTADPDGSRADMGVFPVFSVRAPEVLTVTINGAQADPADLPKGAQPTSYELQRSDIFSLVVEFNDPVNITGSDIVLTNLGVNAPVDPDQIIPVENGQISTSGSVVTISFAPDDLPAGVYELELLPTITSVNSGTPLDGNGDGNTGDSYVMQGNSTNRFYRLESEFNGDFGVSVFDFSTFSYWFGLDTTLAPLYADLNFDGGVSVFDFTIFSNNFSKQVIFPNAFANIAVSPPLENIRIEPAVDEVAVGQSPLAEVALQELLRADSRPDTARFDLQMESESDLDLVALNEDLLDVDSFDRAILELLRDWQRPL
jgi:fibronectin type 3 domain-containing protein